MEDYETFKRNLRNYVSPIKPYAEDLFSGVVIPDSDDESEGLDTKLEEDKE